MSAAGAGAHSGEEQIGGGFGPMVAVERIGGSCSGLDPVGVVSSGRFDLEFGVSLPRRSDFAFRLVFEAAVRPVVVAGASTLGEFAAEIAVRLRTEAASLAERRLRPGPSAHKATSDGP